MNEKRICPIDGTELTPFNQYELQDATICRGCAKKLGLTGIHQSISLANAAKALITLTIAKRYLSAGSKINSTELKQEYKSNVKSGDAPSGYQMFKSTINDAGNKNDNVTSVKEPKTGFTEATVQNDAPTSTADLSDKTTVRNISKEKTTDTHEDNQFNQNKAETTGTNSAKEGPLFWKGSGINGFLTGALAGFIIGIINICFIHFEHLGLIVWAIIWLFMGTNPRYKEKRTDTQIHQEAGELRQRPHDNYNVSVSQTTIINNQAQKRAKRPMFGSLVCPKCHSTNIQLVATDANIKKMKTKTRVNADLNPLHPFRLANVKQRTKVVKKHSAARTVSAMATMGASTLITGGTRSNKSREYHCQDCGKVFYKK